MDSERWFWAVLWSVLPISLTLWVLLFAGLLGGLRSLMGA